MKGMQVGWVSSGPSTDLSAGYPMRIHQQCRSVCEYEKVLCIFKGVHVGMRLFVDHKDGCANRNEVTAVMVVERLVVHVMLKRSGCLIWRPIEENPTSLGPLLSMLTGK